MLLAEWRRLAAEGLNNRAVAERLAVSEADLVESGCGAFVTCLRPDAPGLLKAVRRLGPIKCVVRNDYAVLERYGAIEKIDAGEDGELRARGQAFHLRLRGECPARAFALSETGVAGVKYSVQFFDAEGVSVVKFFLHPESKFKAFQRLVASFGLSAPSSREPEQQTENGGNAARDSSAARTVNPHALERFLKRAASLAVPVRLVVRNPGAFLGTVAPIHNVKRSASAPWINVLDPGLDLHLFEARIRRLSIEPRSNNSGWLHWFGDDGAPAFSSGVFREFGSLAAVTQREPTPA